MTAKGNVADILAFLAQANAVRRERKLRLMPDLLLRNYWEQLTLAVIQTPEGDREIMAEYDRETTGAIEVEMLRRGIHPKRTAPLSSKWRIIRLAAEHHPAGA
jgi:hypothetical protein